MVPSWEHVTVIGCGLIGSSFALGLKSNHLCRSIAGWDSSQSALNQALVLGVIDEIDHSFAHGTTSPADLVYLAMPVRSIINFIKECASLVKPGALITDAGSTKLEVCKTAKEFLPLDRHFIGGHPIAGSHLSGIEEARSDLFSERAYVLVADQQAITEKPFSEIKQTLTLLGARVLLMSPAEHDRAMALVSHLPQLLASALASVVISRPDAEELLSIVGPGYADMTRLASSSWSIWKDILQTNRIEIANSLDQFIHVLQSVRDEMRLTESELPMMRSLFNKISL
ncbi:MAG TPA: prephenate dehydrogenase/arogenate dehydrogenase family protein [Pyrinomonadaceae bacterium]|nr:prephenate dehydrogenase/arogenate dehydrogenase family protein [Pyrinomonadaceae bacterium]